MNIDNFKKDGNSYSVNSNKNQRVFVCQESAAVFKENLRRHFKTNHEHYGDMDMEQRLHKVKELKRNLQQQQNMLTQG